MATSSAVSNLERRLDVLEEQAAENQYNLVRNKLRMWKGCRVDSVWLAAVRQGEGLRDLSIASKTFRETSEAL